MEDDLDAELANVDVSNVQMNLDDLDLDETLGLSPSTSRAPMHSSTPAAKQPAQVEPRAASPLDPNAPPQSAQAADQSASWWGNIWTAASTVASTAASNAVTAASTIAAQNPELTHALDNARKKIESGSERLRERVADVARTTATRTLDGVEKLLDVIDPIQLSQDGSATLFSFEEWVGVKDDPRVKILVCTLDPAFFAAASLAFERLHGDGSIYVRGLASDADADAAVSSFAPSLAAAAQSASERLDRVLALPESQRPPDEFIMVTMVPFLADIASQTYFGVAAMLHDVRCKVRVSSFSPLVQVERHALPEAPRTYEWFAEAVDGQLSVAEVLDAAMQALLGAYWHKQRQAGLVQEEGDWKE